MSLSPRRKSPSPFAEKNHFRLTPREGKKKSLKSGSKSTGGWAVDRPHFNIPVWENEAFTLPETNIAHENPIFPGKYHQNGGFSMAMLVYRGVEMAVY